jgi:hypothetical protein
MNFQLLLAIVSIVSELLKIVQSGQLTVAQIDQELTEGMTAFNLSTTIKTDVLSVVNAVLQIMGITVIKV